MTFSVDTAFLVLIERLPVEVDSLEELDEKARAAFESRISPALEAEGFKATIKKVYLCLEPDIGDGDAQEVEG